VIGLGELAGLDVVHGPRRLSPVSYDAWLAILRKVRPHFEFTDPPFRQSLPITLAFAASTSRPTAVLTGPHHRLGDWHGRRNQIRRPTRPAWSAPGSTDLPDRGGGPGLEW
jgi:hypothetical protein